MIRALSAAGVGAALVAAGASGAWGADATVRITDRVEPPAVTVPAGGSVTWHNDDDQRHRVRSTTGPDTFDSGNLEPSQTWSETFALPGVYRYVDARDDADEAYWGAVTVTGHAGDGHAGDGQAGDGQAGDGGGGGPISMVDRSFSPATVSVPAGTTVTWVNDSDREHTVTADDGSFDSGTLAPGARFTHTFEDDGSYGYFCALHGGMRGTVTVGAGQGGGESDGHAAGSGQPSSSETGGTAPSPASTGGGAGGEAEDDVAVEVLDFAFDPDTLEVQAGTTVTWRQAGELPHTVTSEDGSFDSGTLQGGDTFSHTFADPGAYRYVCRLHPQMVAAVTVAGDAPAGDPDPVATGSGGGAALAASSPGAAGAPPTAPLVLAVLLLLAVALPASVLLGAWRIERVLRRLATPAAPPTARRPPART